MSWSKEAQKAMIDKQLKTRDLCEKTGYTRQHINNIVKGKYNPMPKEATITICSILDIAPPEW